MRIPTLPGAANRAASLENDMERDNDLIDLGSASVETRGPVFGHKDELIGQNPAGLIDN